MDGVGIVVIQKPWLCSVASCSGSSHNICIHIDSASNKSIYGYYNNYLYKLEVKYASSVEVPLNKWIPGNHFVSCNHHSGVPAVISIPRDLFCKYN